MDYKETYIKIFKKNTLVICGIGFTGFIGSALVRQLLKEGNRVGILVRDETKLDASL